MKQVVHIFYGEKALKKYCFEVDYQHLTLDLRLLCIINSVIHSIKKKTKSFLPDLEGIHCHPTYKLALVPSIER